VDELEKAGDDDFLLAFVEQVQQQPFGELVENEDHRRNSGNAAVGLL
jgi:hypothetical protein